MPRLALAMTILAAACVLAAAAAATSPGREGRIAFMREDGAGNFQVWTARADLTGQRQLTSGDAASGYPAWAPGGRLIAFDSDGDVFTMRPDGSRVVRVTDSHGRSADPAWSPDGRTLAFDADRGDPVRRQGIYLKRLAKGSRLRRVTSLPKGYEADLAPRFSPDGRRLVFTRYRLVDRAAGQPQKELAALFVVRLDGSRLRRITAWSLRAGDADWSPSGRSIVFETNFDAFDNHPADVFTVGSGGGRPRNLTRNAGRTGSGATLRLDGSSDPVWSPDGRSILFLDVHDTAAAPRSGLARMRPDGSRRRFVSADPQAEHQVDVEVAPRRR